MAQFVVYHNKNRATQETYPYLLDIQSNLLDGLRTTVVVPLVPEHLAGDAAITKLCPTVVIENQRYIALTQLLSGIDRKMLGKEVCSVADYRYEFIAALDFIISGI